MTEGFGWAEVEGLRVALAAGVRALDPELVLASEAPALWQAFDGASRLVKTASTSTVAELREACARTRAAADPDPEATHRRIHARRCLRRHTDTDGTWNLIVRGTAEAGARFGAALDPIIDEIFGTARTEGHREPHEAYAFDALIELADRARGGADRPADGDAKPRAEAPTHLALLRLDVEALRRGAVEDDELCEIAGLGPIPVSVAVDLLGESVLKLVLTRGVEVANITHLGRGPTVAQRLALLWMSPKCFNQGCDRRWAQVDHRLDWAKTLHTRLDELDRLCVHDHRLKTHHGWALIPGTGRRAFVPPTDPRHPDHVSPPGRAGPAPPESLLADTG